MPSEAVIIVVVSFLLAVLVSGPSSAFNAFAKPTGPGGTTAINCGPGSYNGKTFCCYFTKDSQGNLQDLYCANCTAKTSYVDCRGATWELQRMLTGNNIGTRVPNSAGITTGNNTGTPVPPGSIIKVPTGTVGSATNPSNNTGTPSFGNIIKVPVNHTNALPTGNKTAPSPPNNATGQSVGPQPLPIIHHHHKGSNTGASTSTGGNSTGHWQYADLM
jgi:hypothetical protein